ncbi:MAG: hypothetical protein KGI71_06340 [Patescibacteria group bacterium]|nr:hypothetical protein [Patescibacteria group bacterium]
MRFYNGQPVICVDDRFGSRWWRAALAKHGITLPSLGSRYAVRGYVDAPGPSCILLVEIANPLVMYGDGKEREASFAETRFQPATDIGDLEKMLTSKSVPKDDGMDNRRKKKQTERA